MPYNRAWLCGQKFTQEFRFKTHLFLQNVLQSYASNIYRHLFEKFRHPIRHRGCFLHRVAFMASVIHLVRLGTAI